MGFNAATAVTPLEWDFTKYGGGSGTSPEPTTAQIERYQRKTENLTRGLQRLQLASRAEADQMTDEQLREQMRQWGELSLDEAIEQVEQERQEAEAKLGESAEANALDQHFCKLVAETLNDCPNQEQIKTLPHRVRFAFYGWVTGQLLDPEQGAADSKPSLSLVRNA